MDTLALSPVFRPSQLRYLYVVMFGDTSYNRDLPCLALNLSAVLVHIVHTQSRSFSLEHLGVRDGLSQGCTLWLDLTFTTARNDKREFVIPYPAPIIYLKSLLKFLRVFWGFYCLLPWESPVCFLFWKSLNNGSFKSITYC